MVNVASECGYTDYNYRHLVELQAELSPLNFTVLAFPLNHLDIRSQDPTMTS